MKTIYIAQISHKYGINIYAGKTSESVIKQVADYCREEWKNMVNNSTPPNENQKVIEIYFSEENAGLYESITYVNNVNVL